MTAVTNATPINTGDAVRDVRFGLRAEFWRAITPVIPRNRAAGRPRNKATGRAMIGPSTMVPINTNKIPIPRYELLAPDITNPTTAIPRIIDANPVMRRLRPGAAISSAVARIAANGGTLPARRAGKMADRTVTMSPMMMVDTTVFCDTTRPPFGISMLTARRSALRPADKPIPATRPMIEPMRPTAMDSINMVRVICLRLAPMARNNAFSR